MDIDWKITFGDILTIASFAGAIVAYWRGQVRERRQNTLEAYRQLEPTLAKIELKKPSEYREIAKNSENDDYKERYKEARAMAAEVEHFCVGITKGIYDKGTVFELGGVFLNRTIKDRISPIIDNANQKSGMDHYSNTHSVMNELNKIEKKTRNQKRQGDVKHV